MTGRVLGGCLWKPGFQRPLRTTERRSPGVLGARCSALTALAPGSGACGGNRVSTSRAAAHVEMPAPFAGVIARGESTCTFARHVEPWSPCAHAGRARCGANPAEVLSLLERSGRSKKLVPVETRFPEVSPSRGAKRVVYALNRCRCPARAQRADDGCSGNPVSTGWSAEALVATAPWAARAAPAGLAGWPWKPGFHGLAQAAGWRCTGYPFSRTQVRWTPGFRRSPTGGARWESLRPAFPDDAFTGDAGRGNRVSTRASRCARSHPVVRDPRPAAHQGGFGAETTYSCGNRVPTGELTAWQTHASDWKN